MTSRLHVFDMDGTLLKGAAALDLSRYFGKLDEGFDIENRWAAGQITDTEFWSTLLAICDGATEAELDAAFEQAQWLDGVVATFEDIRRRDETVIVISQSPAFFVNRLRQWGAHETYGSDVVIGEPLAEDATLSPKEKVTITKAALERLSLSPDDCVAYGDSSSDIELFGWLENTVAVNASPAVAELASVQYRGDDLRAAYELGRGLFGAPSRI